MWIRHAHLVDVQGNPDPHVAGVVEDIDIDVECVIRENFISNSSSSDDASFE